ncbi:MAG: tetratricopeptide repeat protein, partial [Chloroflexi bacterium]|nr:tetratricopeptide repeat protein [Chloroflexota bacterium]
MAKISLRSYNHEIEGMIERGQLDEAIAHCRHILQTFPKHLETYRLLGKTYLEAKRYNEAVDIFQRVLVSVPDDFVSHVGMSIIADEQSKLDEAIWHMERAFEVQPSNAAIQGELQRLFGRRDGVQPPKIRLTRGALAHMYVQGELYMQAISEIQAVLGSDAGRTDMKVLLGKAYFRNGQKPEANDICNQLLKQFPYCLDANRIMVEILPASQAAESTQVYRHRVSELDPYAMFVQDSIFHSDEVPDASVNLERFEYTGQPVDLGANWGGTLGIGLASDATAVASAADQPDWLKAASATPNVPAPPTAAAAPQSGEQIPDFMRQAGWTASSGEEVPSEATEPEAVQADLPDWVKAMAPSDQSTAASAPEPEPVVPAADVPDWLKGLGDQEPPASAPASTSAPQDESDWLRNLGGSQPPEEQTPAADLPDWLKSLDQPESKPATSEPATVPPLPDETPAIQAAATPSSAPTPPSALGDLGTSAQEQDDAMAWLESLAAKHGA